MSDIPAGFLTIEEAAVTAKVSQRQILRMIKEKRIEFSDFGTGSHHLFRIRPEALANVKKPADTPQPSARRRHRATTPASTELLDLFPKPSSAKARSVSSKKRGAAA